jgi:zinc transporter
MLDIPERPVGLLWGLAFRQSGAIRLRDETLSESLAQGCDWIWLHFGLSDHRARRMLQDFTAVPEAARLLLLGAETRPQLHLTQQCCYGVVPEIERDFEGETLGLGRLAFWLDGKRLFTTRLHPMLSVDEVRGEAEKGRAFAGPAEIFARIVAHFVELAETRLGKIAGQLDRFEDSVLADRGDQSRLAPLRRELAGYHREFGALRTIVHRAAVSRHSAGESLLGPYLADLQQDVDNFHEDAVTQQERARLLYEEMDSRAAAATNRSVRALTIISTLLLPPTFVVGAFGMNLSGIPWTGHGAGFWWAIGLCAITVLASYMMLRRFRIL